MSPQRPTAEPPSSGHAVPRVTWVTNVSAPYRRPVWAVLAGRAHLTVGLLSQSEPNRQWTSELPRGVVRLRLKTLSKHRGDIHAYALLKPALRGTSDVVVLPGWESPAAWQLLLEARLRRMSTVAFYESATGSHRFSSGPVARLRGWFFRQADAVLTVGAASEAAVLGFGVDPARVVSTYNAVDVVGIAEGASSSATSRAQRAQRIIYVGQLIQRKNVAALIQALVTMTSASTLVIAGEGPEEASLKRLVENLGLSDRVRFAGYVPYADVPQLLSTAGTLALPSTVEVYGLVVVEALAAGLQVVVTENCGVYQDVRALEGVFPAEPTPDSLGAALDRSIGSWSGPRVYGPVMERTPEAMADDVLWACVVARSNR